MINVAVDAMGGDNAPGEIVKGAVQAVNKRSDIHVLLVGQEEAVKKELASHTYPKEQITLVQASEGIETEEPPVNANRKKEGFFHCSGNEPGKERRGRRVRVSRQFRSSPGRRTGAGGTHQRCGTAALWRIDPDGKGCIPAA
mgnify:CR=1 FL=1